MKDILSWQYNEFKQVGKDYSLPSEVKMYDSRHSDFRDIEKESDAVLDILQPGKNDVIIDFGSGPGTFAIQAALRCAKVYAVDVSQPMIDYAIIKAEKAGVSNIEFCHSGFLNFEYKGPSVDFITTTFAFHHLPDFWKGIALKRMNIMLKPGGQLFIHDAIIEEHHALENIAALIEKLAAAGGNFLQEDAEGHFREEFSTYDWIMDGLLSRTGFAIKSKNIEDGVIGTYYCTKQ
ncbi:demethylrebeccamycin-D-glucose O-methyltransferase [bacterium BMS3Abin07]|nr:demethylrebeccamycin-D-glucose O-methyltransferase [bacterium BMS3Abin07]GBE33477.1 demethylrebeccamycin-D-glucose O-methyltransferase [bacterium BMS3Bbin05]HDH10437.1 class I SAM-dependent methyltransferase [Deltaproteobacteria bacterium]HDO21626.1 class I SAM-dependent methyltransferase [Nitrospirota bacterium]